MTDISLMGLGLMGAALARALHREGHDLTVWNRTPTRTQPFADAGVAVAEDAAAAIAASPVVVICIDDYDATHALLCHNDIAPLLAGRTIVQLSTGSPKQAAEAAQWMHERGIHYLDGAILAGPGDIDNVTGEILLCGDADANDRAGAMLQCLAGSVRYLGSNVRAASALDLAWLTVRYGEFISVAHAANLCRSEEADLGDFISLFADNPIVQERALTVHEDAFDECTATLGVWGAALAKIQKQGRDAGINTDFPDTVAGLFDKAVAAGYGQQHAMAICKVLRTG